MSNLAQITRANFLPLAIVIALTGLTAAFYAHATFNPFEDILVLIGALLTHAAVNVFNNYFDYRSGVDAKTLKTPFSGGVDILVQGKMKPSLAVAIGAVCLLAAALIGAYFLTLVFYPLFPILTYGFVAIILYTPLLSKIPAVSEIIAGSGFGFMALGAYVTQAGAIDKTGLSILAPVSILVGLLLFLNEFPDMEADMTAGRRHIVILFGRKSSALIYVAGLIATYLSIVVAVVAKAAPVTVLISLATVPIAFRAGRLALKYYDQVPELVPALASNVMLVLSTILLIAVGFLLGPYL